MIKSELSRRTFLLAGIGAVTTACARNLSLSKQKRTGLNIGFTTATTLANRDERIAFVLRDDKGRFIKPGRAIEVEFGPTEKSLSRSENATAYTDVGNAPAPGYVVATYRFPKAGQYVCRVTYHGEKATAPITVVDTSAMPASGDPMIAVPTPTFATPLGVNPICTRNPPCRLHDISLDAALKQRKPIALLFGTPALCETQTCGPTLETLLAQQANFPSVRFLHMEIYTDMSATTRTAPVEAYHLEEEPILFLANADGVVNRRVDGLFGTAELSEGLKAIAG